MYAIIATGGKQYRVKEGDVLKVEKLGLEPGAAYTFNEVLAVSAESLKIGSPLVEGASVSASFVSFVNVNNIILFNDNIKKGYHQKNGHRQQFTQLKIDKINV